MDSKIAFVKTIKQYGEARLGLRFDGSFEKIAEDEFSCNWVYASPKDSLKSVFENNAPFEFYGAIGEALRRFEELKTSGYDTYFYHAEAHGGKECPITKEMLESPKARQCYVVIHEAWHATCRLNKYHLKYPYEESTGRVIGLFGGIALARELNDSKLLKSCIDQEIAWSMFADFVNESRDVLTQAMAENRQRLS